MADARRTADRVSGGALWLCSCLRVVYALFFGVYFYFWNSLLLSLFCHGHVDVLSVSCPLSLCHIVVSATVMSVEA